MSKNYGMSYMGSKSKIAPQLVDYMVNRHPNKTIFIDACCGGLAITAYLVKNYPSIRVISNDYSEDLISLYKDSQDKEKWQKLLDECGYKFIDRETFASINKNGTPSQKALMLMLWSFGNKGAAYLYGKDIECQKELLSNLLIFGENRPSEYYKKHYKEHIDEIDKINEWFLNECPDDIKRLDYKTQPIKRIKFLNSWKNSTDTRITQLERLERLERLELHCGDAIEFIKSLPKEKLDKAIIYFDPPYVNTGKYKISDYAFNEQIRQFAIENKDIPIYISEYTQYDGLELCYYETKLSLLNNSKEKKTTKKEILMYNGCKDKEEALFNLLGAEYL